MRQKTPLLRESKSDEIKTTDNLERLDLIVELRLAWAEIILKIFFALVVVVLGENIGILRSKFILYVDDLNEVAATIAV